MKEKLVRAMAKVRVEEIEVSLDMELEYTDGDDEIGVVLNGMNIGHLIPAKKGDPCRWAALPLDMTEHDADHFCPLRRTKEMAVRDLIEHLVETH